MNIIKVVYILAADAQTLKDLLIRSLLVVKRLYYVRTLNYFEVFM